MLRTAALLLLSAAVVRGMHPAEQAAREAWGLARAGNAVELLRRLEPETRQGMEAIFRVLLERMKDMSTVELSLVFAAAGLDCAANEVQYWDEISVLEMFLSMPTVQDYMESSVVRFDSVTGEGGEATVHISVRPEEPWWDLDLHVRMVETPSGWRACTIDSVLNEGLGFVAP